MKDIGVVDLLTIAGLDPTRPTKLVRHQQAEYPVEELLRSGWLDLYQGYQGRSRFHKTDYIVSFTALNRNRALLYGVFRNEGFVPALQGPAPADCPWVQQWRAECKYYYDFKRVPGFEALERRLVIDWGRAALAWHQRLRNKPVLELLAPGRRLPPFVDYLDFSLTFDDLRSLVAQPEAHADWRTHLEAVAGIYLVLASTTGELYVGSACGTEGVWGRWSDYAATGHGHNALLRKLLESDTAYPHAFRYSLLQILPKSWTVEEVYACERRYKDKLGSRAHGLNLN